MRRRVPRPRRASTTATVVQIALLTLTLVAVLSFHHLIANRTSALVAYLAPGESPAESDAIAPVAPAAPPLAPTVPPAPNAGSGDSEAAPARQPGTAHSPARP